MYRFLLTRRWVGGLALAVVAAVACVLLGTWQWGRHEQRTARNELVVANYDRPPAPLSGLVPAEVAGWRLPLAATWTPVRLAGTYDAAATVLVRNRPLAGQPGYHVLVPFRTDVERSEGPQTLTVLVDRGWLPAGEDGDAPDAVPAPPAGPAEVVLRLRPPEEASDRVPPRGQAYRITPAQLAPATPDAATGWLAGVYGELAVEQPEPSAAPTPLPRPELEEGPHLSYALQWVMFALLALAAFVVVARRTAHEDDPDVDGAPDAGQDGVRGGRRVQRPSDEEVEDAAVDASSVRT